MTKAVVGSDEAPAGFVRRELPVGEDQVEVYAGLAEQGGDAPATVVVVVAPSTRVPSRAEVRNRFGLTRREAEVALLLAARQSNKEIARHLSIADKTAWRHTERVMSKLNTRSRREVGRVLRAGTESGQRGAGPTWSGLPLRP